MGYFFICLFCGQPIDSSFELNKRIKVIYLLAIEYFDIKMVLNHSRWILLVPAAYHYYIQKRPIISFKTMQSSYN